MTNSIKFTKELASDFTWMLTAEVTPGGTLPLDIFLYENSGGVTPGPYQGVCDLGQYQKYRAGSSTPILVFGNKYLRYSSVKIRVNTDAEINQVKTVLIGDVTNLAKAISASASTTETILIP